MPEIAQDGQDVVNDFDLINFEENVSTAFNNMTHDNKSKPRNFTCGNEEMLQEILVV